MIFVPLNFWKKIIVSYGVVFVIFSTIFLSLFQIDIQKIFFYKGLVLLGITFFFCLIGITIYTIKTKKNAESLLAALMICAAINLSVFIMFPVTFERSVTMYMLSTLENAKGKNSCPGMTKKQMESALVQTYIVKNRAVDKRVSEQIVIQNVAVDSQCITLTKNGHRFLDFSRALSTFYNLQIPSPRDK